MRRLLTGLLVRTVGVAAGCGGDDPASRTTGTTAKNGALCASGEGNVEIADVLPRAPRGLEIVEANKEDMEPIVAPMRQSLGDGLRDMETRAVIPADATAGTGLILANFSEDGGAAGDVVLAARRIAEKNPDTEYEEIEVAGARGVLVSHPTGDVQVSAPIGECAPAVLFDRDRDRILRVANALRAPSGP